MSDNVEIVYDASVDDSTPLTAEEIARLEEEWPIYLDYDPQSIQWIARECLIPVYKIMRWDAQRRMNQSSQDPFAINHGGQSSSQSRSQSQQDQTPLTAEDIALLEKEWPIVTSHNQMWIDWFSAESGIPAEKIIRWDSTRRARRDENVDEGVGSSTDNEGTTEEDHRRSELLRASKRPRQDDSESDDHICKKKRVSS